MLKKNCNTSHAVVLQKNYMEIFIIILLVILIPLIIFLIIWLRIRNNNKKTHTFEIVATKDEKGYLRYCDELKYSAFNNWSTTKYVKLIKERIKFYQTNGFDIESTHQNIGDWVALGGSAPKSTMIIVKRKMKKNDDRVLYINKMGEIFFGYISNNRFE